MTLTKGRKSCNILSTWMLTFSSTRSQNLSRSTLLLKEFSAAAKEMVLKLDIESTARLAKVDNLKQAIARIFDLDFAALRHLDLKDGCVEATFLLPTPVAECVFNKHSSR